MRYRKDHWNPLCPSDAFPALFTLDHSVRK